MDTDQQHNNNMETHDALESAKEKRKAEWLLPYQFKKGQSGNPEGRKPGKSLKEYAKEMLATMTDEERQDFLHGLPKETIWKLAEGNPKQDVDTKVEGSLTIQISEDVAKKYDTPLNTETSSTE
jgi:hypothetical protein